MNTNYSNNNYHPSFGSFNFSKEAKALIKWRVKSNEKLEKLEKICNMENSGNRAARKIDIDAILNLAGNYELRAKYKDRVYYENFFHTPFSFLKKITKYADRIDKHDNRPGTKAIDNLI